MKYEQKLPSGRSFSLNLDLNHPTLLPGVQLITEETLFQGGKLLRPKLCFMVGEALDIPMDQISPFARVAELVHAATLAHDDVLDEATQRRSKQTLNAKLTQAKAILSGDMMLSRAMVELSELGNTALLKRMAEVFEDLVTGEWLQLENRMRVDVPMRTIETIALYKTAAMIEWCVEVPFQIKNYDQETIELARRFGLAMGFAFQCIDDCVDFYSNTSGKAFAHDLSEGLLNQVSRTLLDHNEGLERYFFELAKKQEAIRSEAFFKVVSEKEMEKAIASVKEKAKIQLMIAERTLDEMEKRIQKRDCFYFLRKQLSLILERKS